MKSRTTEDALSVLFKRRITSIEDLYPDEVDKVLDDLIMLEGENERLSILAGLRKEPEYVYEEPEEDVAADPESLTPNAFATSIFGAISTMFKVRDPDSLMETLKGVAEDFYHELSKQIK